MPAENSVSSFNGIHYFAEGWKLVRLPGIRRYVIIPLLVNILLLGGAFIWLFKAWGFGFRSSWHTFQTGYSGSAICYGH